MWLAPVKAVQQLQLEVLSKFGTSPLQPGDCKDLSTIVRDTAGKIVSETTIKRFFGFAAQTFNFSVYTLNALSEYAGFNNWEFFLEHYRQQQSPQTECHPKWQDLKSKTGKITFYTTEAIKNGCGIDFTKTASRPETLPLQHFLASDTVAAVILAPAGFGKSVALAQMVESFWLKEACSNPHDICLFINIHHLNTLLKRGFSIEDWLDNQLNLGQGENVIHYFEQHAVEQEGKFVLIIDGFDDKVLGSDKLKIIYSKLMDLVHSRVNTKWLKVIFSARPDTWNALYNPLQIALPSLPSTVKAFSDPRPEITQVYSLPALSPVEVKKVLQNFSLPEETIDELDDAFIQLLEFPPFLQLACSMIDPKGGAVHEDLLTNRIIGQYARAKVMNSPDYGLCVAVLRKVLEDVPNLKAGTVWSQVELFSGDIRIQDVYRKLLTDQILVEETVEGVRSIPIKRVRFFHQHLACYFMAAFHISEQNGELTEETIDGILTGNPKEEDQTGLLRWVLLYAIDLRNYAAIAQLFSRLTDTQQKSVLFEFLLIQPSKEEAFLRVLRDILSGDPKFKYHFLRSFLFYETHGNRRNYLREPLEELMIEEEDRLNIACLYFLSGLYQLDMTICATQLPLLQRLMQKGNRKRTALHPAELCLFIDQCQKGKIPDPVTKEKILQFEEYFLLSDHNVLSLKDELTACLLFFCVMALKEYKYLEKIPDYVFTEVPSLKMRSHDPFRLLALVMQCTFYLYDRESGHFEKCLSHVDKVLQSDSLISGKKIITMHFEQIEAIRFFMEGEYDKVLQVIHQAQVIAKSVRFSQFDYWCYQMQASAFQALHKQKLATLAEQEAERIQQKWPYRIIMPIDFNGVFTDNIIKPAINH
jgi:hypothetical protein